MKIKKQLTLKETNRLKHVGGPRSKKSSKKQGARMRKNLEIISRLLKEINN